MKCFIGPLLTILLWSMPCLGQTWSEATSRYSFKHYQIEQGLSDNTVYCSLQDKRGFLWFGTRNGINRFDGYHFKNIQLIKDKNPQPHSNRVISIFEDNSHQLWLGGENALYRYDIDNDRVYQVLQSMTNVTNINQDSRGRLWFIANASLYYINLTADFPVPVKSKLFANASSLLIAKNGIFWIGTSDGILYKYTEQDNTVERFDLYAHSQDVALRDIVKLLPYGSAILVATRSQGIKLFNAPSKQYEDILIRNRDQTPLFVRDMIEYKPGEFWCATETGLYILDLPQRDIQWVRKLSTNPFSLSGNAVYTVCRDLEGGIWLGTYFAGLNYYQSQYASFRKHFTLADGSSFGDHVVREIRSDGKKGLWIGTEDDGLYQYSYESESFIWHGSTEQKVGLSSKNIHGIMPDGNYLWIGTYEYGIDLMDVRTHRVVRHYEVGQYGNQMRSNFVLTFLKTRSGTLYAGTAQGLYRYNRALDRFDVVSGIPADLFIFSLTEDHTGKIWIGASHKGIHFFDPKTAKVSNLADVYPFLMKEAVISILEDSRHCLWFATEENGVIEFDPQSGKTRRFKEKNGLTSNYTFKLLEDRQGIIWISTNRGLTRLDPLSGETKQYATANGLLSDQFNFNSGYQDHSGMLYFGSLKGLLAFQPELLSENTALKNIFITGFQVNNIEVSPSDPKSPLQQAITVATDITLPYKQSNLSFDFASLSYQAPEMIRYRYKLEGLDPEWTTLATNRRIYFTNLSPGRYRLFVQSSDGIRWNGPMRSLGLRVLPPFWATWWAYTLYGIFLIGLVYYVTRFFSRSAQIKKEREILDAKMDFFTNVAHEIKTPLTLIKLPLDKLKEELVRYPVITHDVQTMEKNTNRLITLIQQILDLRKTETNRFTLDFKKVNLTALLDEVLSQYYAFLSSYSIACTVEKPGKQIFLDADEEAMRKVLTNLISNAVKHAEKKILITLRLLSEVNKVQIIVENDGEHIPPELKDKIFEPFFSREQQQKIGGTGIGLALVKSLTVLHNGNVHLDISNASHTRFILHLPLEQTNKQKS